MLALVESPNPVPYRAIPRWKIKASLIRYHMRRLAHLGGAKAFRYFIERLKGSAKGMASSATLAPDPTECVILAYDPEPYNGRIVIVQGRERAGYHDVAEGWRSVARGKFEVYSVAGGHDSMFLEPDVDGLGGLFNHLLAGSAGAASVAQPDEVRSIREARP